MTHEQLREEFQKRFFERDNNGINEVVFWDRGGKNILDFNISKLDTYAAEEYQKGAQEARSHYYEKVRDDVLAEVAEEIEKKHDFDYSEYSVENTEPGKLKQHRELGLKQAYRDSASIVRSKMSKNV